MGLIGLTLAMVLIGLSIWKMKPDGTAKTELVGNNNVNPEVDPAVSPDGTQIAYTYGNQEIWVMDSTVTTHVNS